MRLLISFIFLVMIAGCSKSTADCQRACEHLIKLGKADIEASIAKMGPEFADTAKQLRDGANASTASDLATCTSKCSERGLDTSCILASETIDEAMRCTTRK